MRRKLICLVSFVLVLGLVPPNVANGELLGWWKLDEGSGNVANDSSGKGNHGTIHNASGGLGPGGSVWDTDPERGVVLSFNGDETAGAYVDAGMIIPAMTLTNDFTWAFWAKQLGDGTGVNQTMLGNRHGASDDLQFSKFTPTNFEYYNNGNNTGFINYDDLPDGVWLHHAVVKDGASLTYYRNGVVSGSSTINATLVAQPFYMGGDAASERWSGRLSDVRIYDHALTEAEVKQLALHAHSPDPPDGATDVTTPLLSWKAGDTAMWHDVYFGTNPTPGPDEFRGQLRFDTTVYYHVAGLTPGTTYYWRIDEVEADETTIHTGDVWSFSVPLLSASNPDPPDGARWIQSDATLSWNAGRGSIMYQVYLSADMDAVTNGTTEADKGIVGSTSYAATGLDLETTYYWRVDAFDDKGAWHTGDIWSFTTIPIILITDPDLLGWWKLDEGSGTVAIDWSGHDNHGTINNLSGGLGADGSVWDTDPEHGTIASFNGDDTTGAYISAAQEIPAMTLTNGFTWTFWAKQHPDQSTVIPGSGNDVVVGNRYGGTASPVQFIKFTTGRFEYYNGDHNGTIDYGDMLADVWLHHAVVKDGPNLAYYRNGRLAATSTTSATIDENPFFMGGDAGGERWRGWLRNVRIYARALTQEEIKQTMRGDPLLAWDPSPANRSIPDIDGATPLSWQPGDEATQHDVYLGTDETAVKNADTSDTTGIYRARQAATTYTPLEALQWGQTYYWRIDEVNNDATISQGKVWSFTVADYLIVDDFEGYDDYCDRIFYAWKDGWGHSADPDCGVEASAGNSTGSTVGNLAAPYAEQTIVHGGNQSMPYEYNNTGTGGKARYSEASREFATGQNWTRNEVKALALWFHGETGNDPETLYVAVEDSAGQVRVATHPDPEALQGAAWQQWNIALQHFGGVNLASVKKLYIGVGNRNNPQAGGSGKLYFDDIRIYPPRCVPRLAKPAADLSGNCIVDYADVEIVSDQWLDSGFIVTPVDPGTAGLTAHYPLNGNTNDVAGGNNGTTSGIVSYTTGKVGQAILFDGVDDLVTVGAVGISGAAPRTIAGWARANATTAIPDWTTVFGFSNDLTADQGGTYFDIQRRGGQLQYCIHVYGWERNLVELDLDWHHLAATYDGTAIAWYADGRFVNSENYTIDTLDNVMMGKRGDRDSYFPGRVDEVRIYNRALPGAEIAWLAGRTLPFSIPADLYQDDVIDFKDFAVLADSWLEELLWP
jgi:hypothetical protein